MQIINQRSDQVAVDALRPHPRNPRRGDTEAIKASIQANGFYGAVIAQTSTGFVIAGNHRWRAAQELGLEQIPVIWLDVDDEQALRLLLVDNRSNDLAGYDEQALLELLEELDTKSGALAGTGFSDEALLQLTADAQPPGFSPEDLTDVPRLDRKRPITCPSCGHEFETES